MWDEFSHIHRIAQDGNLLTCLLLGLLSAHLIWFHYCWPGWKLKLATTVQQFHRMCFWQIWSGEGATAWAATHFNNYNFNLHIWWQIQFGLERFHHGNQQMNSGQKVFVVDDWRENNREQNAHKKKISLQWCDRTHHHFVWKQQQSIKILDTKQIQTELKYYKYVIW